MQLPRKRSAPWQLCCAQSSLHFLGEQIHYSFYANRENLEYVNLLSRTTSFSSYSGRCRPEIVIFTTEQTSTFALTHQHSSQLFSQKLSFVVGIFFSIKMLLIWLSWLKYHWKIRVLNMCNSWLTLWRPPRALTLPEPAQAKQSTRELPAQHQEIW